MVPPRRPLHNERKAVRAVRRTALLTHVELNAVYFLFECCNRTKYGHLRTMSTMRTSRSRKRAFTFELFAGENQTLLIRWNTFLVLNLCLDIFNGVRRLDLVTKVRSPLVTLDARTADATYFEGDRLTRESLKRGTNERVQYPIECRSHLDEDLHDGQ